MPTNFTFCELTTVSSEARWTKPGGLSKDRALCSFFSRTVGSCEEAEATEGRERRPRALEGSLLSDVDSVEELAEEECLLSVPVAASLPVASTSTGSHTTSSLKGGSISIAVQDIRGLYYNIMVMKAL